MGPVYLSSVVLVAGLIWILQVAVYERLHGNPVGDTSVAAERNHVLDLVPGVQVGNVGTVQNDFLVVFVRFFEEAPVAVEQAVGTVSALLVNQHPGVFLDIGPVVLIEIRTREEHHGGAFGYPAILSLGQLVAAREVRNDLFEFRADGGDDLVLGSLSGLESHARGDVLFVIGDIAVQGGETEIQIAADELDFGDVPLEQVRVHLDVLDIVKESVAGLDACVRRCSWNAG